MTAAPVVEAMATDIRSINMYLISAGDLSSIHLQLLDMRILIPIKLPMGDLTTSTFEMYRNFLLLPFPKTTGQKATGQLFGPV
jgi:hypothetical protein